MISSKPLHRTHRLSLLTCMCTATAAGPDTGLGAGVKRDPENTALGSPLVGKMDKQVNITIMTNLFLSTYYKPGMVLSDLHI